MKHIEEWNVIIDFIFKERWNNDLNISYIYTDCKCKTIPNIIYDIEEILFNQDDITLNGIILQVQSIQSQLIAEYFEL